MLSLSLKPLKFAGFQFLIFFKKSPSKPKTFLDDASSSVSLLFGLIKLYDSSPPKLKILSTSAPILVLVVVLILVLVLVLVIVLVVIVVVLVVVL